MRWLELAKVKPGRHLAVMVTCVRKTLSLRTKIFAPSIQLSLRWIFDIETKIKFSNRPKVCVINPGILASMSMGIYLLLELRIAGFDILFYIFLSWKLLLESKSVFGLCALSLQNNTTSSSYIFAQFSKLLVVQSLVGPMSSSACWLQMILYSLWLRFCEILCHSYADLVPKNIWENLTATKCSCQNCCLLFIPGQFACSHFFQWERRGQQTAVRQTHRGEMELCK